METGEKIPNKCVKEAGSFGCNSSCRRVPRIPNPAQQVQLLQVQVRPLVPQVGVVSTWAGSVSSVEAKLHEWKMV